MLAADEVFRTEFQRDLLRTVRAFAQREIRPYASRIDRDDEFPLQLYRNLGELGVLGATAPQDDAGAGLDEVTMCLVLEELASASGTVANAVLLAKLQADLLVRTAGQGLRRHWVPRISSGATICLIAVTEPGAGSDVAGIRTTATPDDDGWILDGVKAFMTAGAVGDLAVVLARTSEDRHRGLTAFLVEKSPDGDPTRGFVVDHKDDLMGMRGLGTAGIALSGTRVPGHHVLGSVGGGFDAVMTSFDNGRIAIASLALGLAVDARNAAIAYAREREAFGRTIGDFQTIRSMLADMTVAIDAARLLIHRAAALKDAGHDYAVAASEAKLFASDAANRVADNALQIHGGYGYTKEARVERIYRDVRLTRIYEGTNQIQRGIIGRYALAEGARS